MHVMNVTLMQIASTLRVVTGANAEMDTMEMAYHAVICQIHNKMNFRKLTVMQNKAHNCVDNIVVTIRLVTYQVYHFLKIKQEFPSRSNIL